MFELLPVINDLMSEVDDCYIVKGFDFSYIKEPVGLGTSLVEKSMNNFNISIRLIECW